MIQALNTKQIEPKASVKAKGESAAEGEAVDAESMLEGVDFASELASLGEEAELKVKPVEVSPEQLMEAPSTLIKKQESGPDSINPKIFDPALTKGVDKIVQPKTTAVELTPEQVQELANMNTKVDPEVAQAMLKTPQVQTGRAPAIDLAKAEIDPQLMNMDDFVAQKNLAVKKSLNNTAAYGMPQKGQAAKAGADTGLKSTQVVSELGAVKEGTSGLNSQQFILNSQIDLNAGSNAKVNEAHAPVKTFNMSNLKTENPNQIMTQITDYIVQAKAAKEPTVNMRVNHEELGMIDITVNKIAGNDAIAINIGTHSVDGKNFFQSNSKDLFTHLTSTGLNVSDLKVETPSQTARNDFDFGSQSGRNGSQSHDRQFGSEQNQRRHESERRQDLWNLLRDKEAA